MLTPEAERNVEHAIQVLAALLICAKGTELLPEQLLVEADKAIDGLKSISSRYQQDEST
jgi:hypothetical protein